MTKILTYSSFAAAIFIVFMIFLTAQTYPQLAAAAILYPVLIYLGFMLFPRNGSKSAKITMLSPQNLSQGKSESPESKKETTYIADIDKRVFLKLIGATGVSFFLISIFGRRFESLIFGRTMQPGIIPLGTGEQAGQAGASPTEGYRISDIDEGPITYYGFINNSGSWLIMREATDGNSFRYSKGTSDFKSNWANRENLKYDYFHNLY